MSEDMDKTESWKAARDRAITQVEAEGGSTGSNMAEKPYIPPNVKEILKNIPAEELEKTDAEVDALLAK